MKNIKRQSGFIVTIELLILATVLVLGLIVGMTSLRDSVLAELSDVSESVGQLNQSFSIFGVQNEAQTAKTAGSAWQDGQDKSSAGKNIDVQNASGDSDGEYTFTEVWDATTNTAEQRNTDLVTP